MTPLLWLLVAGCANPDDTADTASALAISGSAWADTIAADGTVTVRGTATHARGLNLRAVRIEGADGLLAEATSTGDRPRFSGWTATLRPGSLAPGRGDVVVHAVPAEGQAVAFASLTLGTTDLGFADSAPFESGLRPLFAELPLNSSDGELLSVTTTVGSAALVQCSTQATPCVRVESADEGTAIVTVRSANEASSLAVRFKGAPQIHPSLLTGIEPTVTVPLTVTGADICTPTLNTSSQLSGLDLIATTDPARLELVFAQHDTHATLTCYDSYGQTAFGAYTSSPAPAQ